MNYFIIIISLFFISCTVGPPRYDTKDIKETHVPSSGFHIKYTGNPPPNIYDHLGLRRPSEKEKEIMAKKKEKKKK